MKHLALIVAVLLALALPLSSGGCAALSNSAVGKIFTGKTAAEKVSAAEETYTEINNSITRSVESGLITDKDFIRWWRAAQIELDADLDLAKSLENDPKAFASAWPAVRAKVDDFVLQYATRNKSKPE